MSEQHIPDLGGDLPVMIDPAVQRSLDQLREFQAELDLQPNVSSQRVSEMLQELDTNWFHYNELVSLTGNLHCPVVDIQQEETEFGEVRSAVTTMMREDGEREMCTYFASGIEFTSRGFIVDTEPFMVGGLDVGIRTVLYMMFTRNVSVSLPDRELPQQLSISNFASVDEILMDFKHDSLEYNRLKSQEYFPEFMTEVDGYIDGTKRIADDIMALKGLEAVIDPKVVGDTEVLALEAYLDELIDTTQDDVPFLAKVEDATVFYDPTDKADVLSNYDDGCTLMFRVLGIRLAHKTVTRPLAEGFETIIDKKIIEPRIAIQLLGRDSDDDSIEVELRLAQVEILHSVRQSFYPEDEDEDGSDA